MPEIKETASKVTAFRQEQASRSLQTGRQSLYLIVVAQLL
jgi:hypothetical protein